MVEENAVVGDENAVHGMQTSEGVDNTTNLQAEGKAIMMHGAAVEGESEEAVDELPSPFQPEIKYCTLDFIEDPGKSRGQSTTVKKKGELCVRPIQCIRC